MNNNLNINNSEFIDLINEGDANAFQLLFKLYRSKLLFIANSYISCNEDAEEIIQDVFLKVWSQKIFKLISMDISMQLLEMLVWII